MLTGVGLDWSTIPCSVRLGGRLGWRRCRETKRMNPTHRGLTLGTFVVKLQFQETGAAVSFNWLEVT